MNKKELTVVVVLFVLLAWIGFQGKLSPKPPPDAVTTDGLESVATNAPVSVAADGAAEPVLVAPHEPPVVVAPATSSVPVGVAARDLAPEETCLLTNSVLQVAVSSRGGVITQVVVKAYRESLARDSGPIVLDFSSRPALALSGVAGFSTRSDFEMSLAPDSRSVTLTEKTEAGLVLERSLVLGEEYSIEITDVLRNASGEVLVLPESLLALGVMSAVKSKATSRRYSMTVGLDTFSSMGGAGAVHWARKGPGPDKAEKRTLVKRFSPQGQGGGFGCSGPNLSEPLPVGITIDRKLDTDWIGVKNRFFIQLLCPEEAGSGFVLNAERDVPETESRDDPSSWAKAAILKRAWADLRFPSRAIEPDQSLIRKANYYVGPQKYSALATLGKEQEKVMFRAWKSCGWFRTICIGMLWCLNWIYDLLPNYGVAIILLTIAVRILFWPLTHKSTKSMEKMRELQPEITALKEKYQDNPQKMQKETMQLYREHGVNPMASCFPMLFQMPVFIALFIVLRSAVELRYKSFLWIKDLSEPEGLFPGLPFIGSLNILPVLMTVTMVWQQKLTPQTGDAQQQRMMMVFMPLFMLYIMYSMPSALTLYWTVSQFLALAQLLMQRRAKAAEASA